MVNRTHVSLFLVVLGLGLFSLLWLPIAVPSTAAQKQSPGDGSLLFIENTRHFAPDVRFLVRAGDQTLWLLDDALWVSAPAEAAGRLALRLTFDGANPSPALTPL